MRIQIIDNELIARIWMDRADPKSIEYVGVTKDFEPIRDDRWKLLFNFRKDTGMVVSYPKCGLRIKRKVGEMHQDLYVTHIEGRDGFIYPSNGLKQMCYKGVHKKIYEGKSSSGNNFWQWVDKDENPVNTTRFDDIFLRVVLMISIKSVELFDRDVLEELIKQIDCGK